MTEIRNSKHYDLEERTFNFAKRVAGFCTKLLKTTANIEFINFSQKQIGLEFVICDFIIFV